MRSEVKWDGDGIGEMISKSNPKIKWYVLYERGFETAGFLGRTKVTLKGVTGL